MSKKRLSSYNRIKAERDYLLTVIMTIAKNPNSNESKILLMRYKHLSDIETALWYGNATQ